MRVQIFEAKLNGLVVLENRDNDFVRDYLVGLGEQIIEQCEYPRAQRDMDLELAGLRSGNTDKVELSTFGTPANAYSQFFVLEMTSYWEETGGVTNIVSGNARVAVQAANITGNVQINDFFRADGGPVDAHF